MVQTFYQVGCDIPQRGGGDIFYRAHNLTSRYRTISTSRGEAVSSASSGLFNLAQYVTSVMETSRDLILY
jgi:hypothetical protein